LAGDACIVFGVGSEILVLYQSQAAEPVEKKTPYLLGNGSKG